VSAAPVQDNSETAVLADRERWYAAVSYVFFLCFFGLWRGKDSEFIRFHARQGFLLFVAECVCLAAVIVIDRTVGRLPFLGLLVVIVLQIIVYLGALFLSVVGFVKAIFGERWRMPVIGKYIDRVPTE
jgi:fumarate reductase subunit D